jgi:hypothetical protein
VLLLKNMPFTIEKKFSDAISRPLITAYQRGGLGLTFLVLGALFLFASAFLDRSNPSMWVLASAGFLLIIAVVALFYFQAIRPLRNAQNAVSDKADAIDAVQRAAMQMTEMAFLLEATAFKHAETIRQIITVATSKVREIPVVGASASTLLDRVLEKYNDQVVDFTEEAKCVISGVRDALARADADQLNLYVDQLAQVRDKLALALKASTNVALAGRAS